MFYSLIDPALRLSAPVVPIVPVVPVVPVVPAGVAQPRRTYLTLPPCLRI